MVTIALDGMGGDFGPEPIISGLLEAHNERAFNVIITGDEEAMKPFLPTPIPSWITIDHTTDTISMSDSATDAVRRKESTIYKAVEHVRNGTAQAVVSAGHSGSTMSLATLRIGRLKGVNRPAIATLMPNGEGGRTLVLDVGANVDSKPENLLQFAIMGKAYAMDLLKLTRPRVGLLANGEEPSKGNELIRETHAMLKELKDFNFIGNVEGNDIFKGTVDVVVCDGFEGNILLKTSEGVAEAIKKIIKRSVNKSWISKLGAVLMMSAFKQLKKETDYAEYGGAPLLGIKGCAIVSHGKSNSKAMKNAIFQAISYVDSDVNCHIEEFVNLHTLKPAL